VPEQPLLFLLAAYRRRFRIAGALLAIVAASAAAGAVLAMAVIDPRTTAATRVGAIVVFIAMAVGVAWRSWRRWTLEQVAGAIEARAGTLDNLVIAAEEILSGRAKAPHDVLTHDLYAAALARLERAQPVAVQPVMRFGVAASLAIVAVGALFAALPSAEQARNASVMIADAGDDTPRSPGDLRVVITPPAYARQRPSASVNPTTITALEESAVRLEVMAPAGDVVLHELDGREVAFTQEDGRASLQIVARSSRPLLVRQVDRSGMVADRLVHLRVERDERPAVAIREPAKDLMFPAGAGQIPVQIDAQDDVGLETLTLRYTRVSGSGETFAFDEGEWPLAIEREGTTSWRARAVFSLEELRLQDGDTLVYRAVARDGKPGADPASSETYLIEIGRLAGVASTGFALPDERDRQAISQQMLIIKTERLHADKAKLAPDVFAEQAQLLAVEQRMVKAEFVFMTGGEVEDEVEEATHAHELAEGRLENTGQAELLAAIREMSRAEARLNAAETAQALEFERAALKALQRAFDRRRYLLRTLPERARIDISRRLTGEMSAARSSSAVMSPLSDEPYLATARALLAELGGATAGDNRTLIASRLLAFDPNSEDIQRAALALTSAADASGRSAAIQQAQRALVAAVRARVDVQRPPSLDRDPLPGRLTQELAGRGPAR
jgi:hypothetical protein